MSLFKNLFVNNPKESKSGVFVLQRDDLIELDVLPGSGSFNDIAKSLGYNNSQIHTIITFDSKNIEAIGLKVFTQEVVFAVSKSNRSISLFQLNSELRNVDWGFEYDSNRIEEILNEAIEEKSLTFEYLSSILSLIPQSDSVYSSNKLNLLLHFKDGILFKYSYIDGFNSASRWLRNLNHLLFNELYAEASRNQDTELDAIFEVNNQCDALQSIPNATQNEFMDLHINSSGVPNFYNLWVAHYTPNINMEDFVKMNKNRYHKLSNTEVVVEDFKYSFDENGYFESSHPI